MKIIRNYYDKLKSVVSTKVKEKFGEGILKLRKEKVRVKKKIKKPR